MPEKEPEVTVRRMTEDDFDAVLALGGGVISRADLYLWEPGGPLDMSFIAEVDGYIIGFDLAHIQYFGIPITKVCVISGIVVEHEYRRHGIGNKLVEKVFKSCQEKDVSTVRALVVDGDVRLLHFAEQLGFQRSTVTNYDKIVHNGYQDS